MLLQKALQRLQRFYATQKFINKFLPGITWFFISMILLFLPGSSLPDSENWMQKVFFDKWVHACIFGLLAFLFMAIVFTAELPVPKKWFLLGFIVIFASLWGLATEHLQGKYVAGRTFDLFDWAADTFGAILALAPAYYIFNSRLKISHK